MARDKVYVSAWLDRPDADELQAIADVELEGNRSQLLRRIVRDHLAERRQPTATTAPAQS